MTYYDVTLADGRTFTVEADDADIARKRGNDYGSRVVSVEETETPADDDAENHGAGGEPDPHGSHDPQTRDAPAGERHGIFGGFGRPADPQE